MPQVTWTEAALADIQRHYETLKLIDIDVALRAVQAIRKAGDSFILDKLRRWDKSQVGFGKW